MANVISHSFPCPCKEATTELVNKWLVPTPLRVSPRCCTGWRATKEGRRPGGIPVLAFDMEGNHGYRSVAVARAGRLLRW